MMKILFLKSRAVTVPIMNDDLHNIHVQVTKGNVCVNVSLTFFKK